MMNEVTNSTELTVSFIVGESLYFVRKVFLRNVTLEIVRVRAHVPQWLLIGLHGNVCGRWWAVLFGVTSMISSGADSSSLHSSIAGATAGVVSRIVSAPLDVLKIRFQLQIEPIKKVRGISPIKLTVARLT